MTNDVPQAQPLVIPSPSIAAFPGRIAISPEEFAKAVGLSSNLVYTALARGEIPHRRVGKRSLIGLVTLDLWLAAHSVQWR